MAWHLSSQLFIYALSQVALAGLIEVHAICLQDIRKTILCENLFDVNQSRVRCAGHGSHDLVICDPRHTLTVVLLRSMRSLIDLMRGEQPDVPRHYAF